MVKMFLTSLQYLILCSSILGCTMGACSGSYLSDKLYVFIFYCLVLECPNGFTVGNEASPICLLNVHNILT